MKYYGSEFKVLQDEHIEELETNLNGMVKPRYKHQTEHEQEKALRGFIWHLDENLNDYHKRQKARRKARVETVKKQIGKLEQAKSKLDRTVKAIDEIKKMQDIHNGIKIYNSKLIEPKTYMHLTDAVNETKSDIDRRIKKINAEKIGYYQEWEYFDNAGKKLRKPVYEYHFFTISYDDGSITPDFKILEESIKRPGKKPLNQKPYYYDLIEIIGYGFMF